MSLRITVLTGLLIGLGIYAWRDWFVALCGLILMMAFLEHPDMPKNIAGIQGLNPWNVMMADVGLAWLLSRRREGLCWDMPRHVNALLLLYLGIVLVSFVRMFFDRKGIEQYTTQYLISEYLINCIKWVIPALLVYDGCRTRKRIWMALVCVLSIYLLLAIQVIKYMPPAAALGDGRLNRVGLKVLANEIGYNRVNMSMMLCGGSWAMLCTTSLVRRRWCRLLILAAALVTAYGQALTGGRMGYASWAGVGLVLGLIRWRKLLALMPPLAIVIILVVPGVYERTMQGFGERDVAGQEVQNDYEITSGRTMIWPYVVDKISESPVIGYGRLAMNRTGLTDFLWTQLGESFPHPHNAYLECLLDNGAIGFVLIMAFYLVVSSQAGQLLLDSRSPIFAAVGGVTLALVLSLLIASMGSQTFYPREGAVGMWAAIGLMFRVAVERKRLLAVVPGMRSRWAVGQVGHAIPLPARGVRA